METTVYRYEYTKNKYGVQLTSAVIRVVFQNRRYHFHIKIYSKIIIEYRSFFFLLLLQEKIIFILHNFFVLKKKLFNINIVFFKITEYVYMVAKSKKLL